jgi:hypothetical protein
VSKSDDDAYLVCLRVTDAAVVVPGSTKNTCSACGERVWVSAASLALSKERKLRILCMDCADKKAAEDDDVQVQPPTEEQLKEIRDTIERG